MVHRTLTAIRYSDRFAFAAFTIPEGQLRPFSFQVFDETTVHLGLRSYSMQSGTPTMSAAIMIRNKAIAERFYGEYVENYRKIGAVSERTIGELASSLHQPEGRVLRCPVSVHAGLWCCDSRAS